MPVAATESPQGGLRDSSWFGPQESQVALNQRTMRQRQASDNSATGFSQYSRYDSIAGKVDSRLSTSPTRHAFGTASPYSTQQPVLSTGSYDSSQVSAMVEGDLSVAMRGMAVEHENGLSQHPTAAQPQASSPNASRPGVLPQPQRPPFPAFPQPDYSAYYNAASHVDYTYSFDAYPTSETMYGSPALSAASPSLYPGIPAQGLQTHPPPAMRSPQSSTFFDYASSARPPSQYYYPAQAMMYHPPPPTSAPTGGGHLKRRSMQVSNMLCPQGTPLTRQQVSYQSPMMYPPVASPPSRPRSYHAGAGPMTMHGVFVHDTIRQQVSLQSQNGPGGRGRQREDVNAAFRSALLEEFRNSKDRKWVLKVCANDFQCTPRRLTARYLRQDIYGHVVEFSTDQHGSRFIQQKIETADEEEKQIIFDEIMPHHALRLIQDVFGNYVRPRRPLVPFSADHRLLHRLFRSSLSMALLCRRPYLLALWRGMFCSYPCRCMGAVLFRRYISRAAYVALLCLTCVLCRPSSMCLRTNKAHLSPSCPATFCAVSKMPTVTTYARSPILRISSF